MSSFLVFVLVSILTGEARPKPKLGPKFDYTETNPELQMYQDAWKFVSRNESFVIMYRNFNTDKKNRNIANCVKATKVSEFVSNYTVFNVSYLNMTDNKRRSFLKPYHVISSYSNTMKNVLDGTVYGTNNTEYYPFVFADNECAVIRKDSLSNETFKACEMWQYEKYARTRNSHCDFVFDISCTRGYKQYTYKTTLCRASTARTHEPSNTGTEEWSNAGTEEYSRVYTESPY